jgi:hypothetical protein
MLSALFIGGRQRVMFWNLAIADAVSLQLPQSDRLAPLTGWEQ